MKYSSLLACVMLGLALPLAAQERLSNQELLPYLNQPPQANDDRVEMFSHQVMIIDVLANDRDDGHRPLRIISASAEQGEVTIREEGGLRYTPPPGFSGEERIQYRIYDGVGLLPEDELASRQIDYQLVVRFDEFGVAVSPAYQPELDKLATLMRLAPDTHLQIVAHSAGEGGAAFAQKMSERRAKTVSNLMRQRYGIAPERLDMSALGDSQPLSQSRSRVAQALNRRVELQFSAPLTLPKGWAEAEVLVVVKPSQPLTEEAQPEIELAREGFVPRWYGWIDTGTATGDGSASEFVADVAARGVMIQLEAYDDQRRGYQFGLGYRWHQNWSAELGWINLGDVTTRFQSDLLLSELEGFLNNVVDVHPKSPRGVSLSARYHYPVSEKFELNAVLGGWRWGAEYELAAAGLSVSKAESGVGLIYGAGLSYQLPADLALRLQWQKLAYDDETAQLVSLGVSYDF